MARILIVDDEPRIRSTLSLVLGDRGHHVAVAATGQQAIARVQREPVDAVVLDLRLPDLAGLDVLKAIRTAQPKAGVVIITAYPGVNSSVAGIRFGVTDYLTKPFDNGDLVRGVERALQSPRWSPVRPIMRPVSRDLAQKATYDIHFRGTEAEQTFLKHLAGEWGVSLNAAIRRLIRMAMRTRRDPS